MQRQILMSLSFEYAVAAKMEAVSVGGDYVGED
jgi:hypothetical protein